MKCLRALLLVGAILVVPTAARADMIPYGIPGAVGSAFHRGDSPDPGNGSLSRLLDGHGLSVADPSDSSTWTHNSSWPDNWQGQGSFTGGETPGAWLAIDLGKEEQALSEMYIWNVRERLDRGMQDVDIYFATTPTVTPVTGSPYDFGSGGWTLLGSYVIPQATGANTPYDIAIPLNTIPSARYIGFDIETNYGSTFRVGAAEIQITTPEPTTLSLLALGGLGLLRRRRR